MPYNSIMTRADLSELIPTPVQNEIIDGVAEQSALLSLCRRLPNMTTGQEKMPVVASLPTAYFVGEPAAEGLETTDTKQTTEMTWSYKTIVAEEIAVILPIHENVLADANYDVWGLVKPKIVEAFGVAIDAAQIVGTNKPATWPTALLTAAGTAANTIALGAGGADFVDDVNAAMGYVEVDGFNVTGFLAPIATKGRLRGLRASDGQLIFQTSLNVGTPDTLYGQRINYSRNGSFSTTNCHLIAGDFSQLVYAIRQDLTFKVLTEATIYDPATNNVLYALAQQDMVALRCVMRLGVQLPNPINRLQATEANRYPFGVVLPAA